MKIKTILEKICKNPTFILLVISLVLMAAGVFAGGGDPFPDPDPTGGGNP